MDSPKRQTFKNEDQNKYEKEGYFTPVLPNERAKTISQPIKEGSDSSLSFDEDDHNIGEGLFEGQSKPNLRDLKLQGLAKDDSLEQAILHKGQGSSSPFKDLTLQIKGISPTGIEINPEKEEAFLSVTSSMEVQSVTLDDGSPDKPQLVQAKVGAGESLILDTVNQTSASPFRKLQQGSMSGPVERKKVQFLQDKSHDSMSSIQSENNRIFNQIENKTNINLMLGKKHTNTDLKYITIVKEGKKKLEESKAAHEISISLLEEENEESIDKDSNESIAKSFSQFKSVQMDQTSQQSSMKVQMQSGMKNGFKTLIASRSIAIKQESILSSLKNSVQQSFGLTNKEIKERKEQKRKEEQDNLEKQILEKMTKQLRYSDDCIEQFQDIKEVFRQRVQFSKKNMKLKKGLEAKHKIEIADTQQETIDIAEVSHFKKKQKKVEEDLADLARGSENQTESKQLTGWEKRKQDYEEKLLEIKDDRVFYVHGKYFIYSNRSLGMFDNKNKLRICMVWLINHKWFENFIMALIFLNSMLLGIKDYTDYENVTPINSFIESCEPFFTYMFLIECVSKILAMGFILGNKCYLYDSWNWLDFTVVVTSLLEELPSMENMSGLRTFRLFRPLKSLTNMPSMKLLIGTLFSSIAHLGGLFGLSIFIFIIFAILGVSLWNGRLHYRCYLTEEPEYIPVFNQWHWPVNSTDERLCYPGIRECAPGNYCNSMVDFQFNEGNYGRNMTVDPFAISQIRALNYGITHFDNIFSAILTVFQCITMEGWTHIMNMFVDSYLGMVVNVYFISCVVICSFFLLNLTIAVMLMKYEELDKNQTNCKHNEELRQLGLSIKLSEPMIDFLIKQDSIQITCKAKKMIKGEESFLKQLFAPKRIPVDMNEKYYHNKLVKICLSIGMNPYFDVLIMFVIVINTLCLAGDMYPELDQKVLYVLQYMNFVFTFIFTVEVIVKMIGLGAREFLKEKFNQFDLLIVIISIIEMQLVNSEGEGGVFSALRAIRLFKIFKLFKVGDLRILIDSIAFTMTAISDYVVLLSLFIYVFALLGMSQFAGQLKFDDQDHYDLADGKSPRINFDNVGWSLVLIFQVLLGENWNFIMYDCMRSKGSLSAFYFIALVVGGNIIMLNLFLAILLGNFEKARNFGQKKKVFEAFREIKTDIILHDMSIHVKIKILKWDEMIVEKFHKTGDTSLAQDLMEEGARFMKEESDDELDCECHDHMVKSNRLVDKLIEQETSDKDSHEHDDENHEEQDDDGHDHTHEENESKTRKSDHHSHDNDQMSAIGSTSKDKPEPEKVAKKKFQSAKMVCKIHKYNLKMFRLKEMKRAYNMTDSKALLMILQKELDLGHKEMNLVNEEEILSRYTADRFESALEKSPVSQARVENNIERFQSIDYLDYLDKDQKQDSLMISEHLHKQRMTLMPVKVSQLDSARSKNGVENKNKLAISEESIKIGDNESQSFNSVIHSSQTIEKTQNKNNQERESKELDSISSGDNLMLTLPKKPKAKNKNQVMGAFLEPMTMPNLGRWSSQKQPVRSTTMNPNQKAIEASLNSAEFELRTQKTFNVNKISFDEKNKLEHFRSAASAEDKESKYASNYRDSMSQQKRLTTYAREESFKEPNIFQRLIKNRSDSSLLIFHKNGWLRRKCLILAESPENLEDLYQLEQKERQEQEERELTYLFQGSASKSAVNIQQYQSSEDEEESQNSQSQPITDQSNKLSVQMSHKTSNNQEGITVINQDQNDGLGTIHKGVGSFIGRDQKTSSQKNLYFGVHPSKIFENIVLTLITFSSFTLVVDNPLNDPKSDQMLILAYIDQFFTMMFFMEAIIKIIAKGLIFNRMGPIEPYLSSPWNMLDAFVVLASLIDFVFAISGFDMQQLSAIKALRAFRALRPLRMISRNEGMRLVVNALLASLPSMGNVLLVGSLFLLIFAIMGVNFFKGKFFYCADLQFRREDYQANLAKVITKYDCVNYGGNWVLKDANFDNTISAMLTLFQLTQTEGWIDVMFDGIDSTQVGYQPKQFTSVYLIFYFIAFMTVGSQFIVNLFVGVVIDNFNTIKEREELGNMFVTEQQKSWIDIQKIALLKTLKTKLDEPTDPVRIKFFNLVKMKKFEYTITFFILLNTVFMTLKYHNMNHYLKLISFYANYVFALVFNAEMILKLIGMGSTYFQDSWNKFDCFIVIATDGGLILNMFDIGGGLSTATTVIRGVRILRIFRLIKSSVHIRLILDTIMNILPHIQNVMTLFVLMLFIYAALAINIFSQVQPQYYLDEKNNFQTFTGSMIMLWKFSTGEDWNKFMYELANAKGSRGKKCDDMQTFEDIKQNGINGCGTVMAYPFFITFTVLVTMLILNLSVAAVIGGLDTAKKENMGFVKGDDIENLVDLWQEFDPFASGWIKMDELIFLLYDLPPPMGLPNRTYFDDKNNDPEAQKGLKQQDRYLVSQERCIIMKKVDALDLLRGLNIKVYQHPQKQIHFVSVFKALIKRVFNNNGIDYKLSTTLNRKMKGHWSKKYSEIVNKDKGQYTVREEQAGLIITKWAKKSLSAYKYQVMAKNEQIKKTMNKKKFQIEDQMKAQGKLRKNRQENLIEQADIIQNIIHGQASGRSNSSDHNKKDYAIDNEYSWKNPGGQKIYEDVFNGPGQNDKAHDSSDLVKIKQANMDLSRALFNQQQRTRGKSFNHKLRRNKTLLGYEPNMGAQVQLRKYEQNYYHNQLFSTNLMKNDPNNMQTLQQTQGQPYSSNSDESSNDDTSSIQSTQQVENYESPGLNMVLRNKGIQIDVGDLQQKQGSSMALGQGSNPKKSPQLQKIIDQNSDVPRRSLSDNGSHSKLTNKEGIERNQNAKQILRSKTKLRRLSPQGQFTQMKALLKKDLQEFEATRKQQSTKNIQVQLLQLSDVPEKFKQTAKQLTDKKQLSSRKISADLKRDPLVPNAMKNGIKATKTKQAGDLVLNLVQTEKLHEAQKPNKEPKNRTISTLKTRQNASNLATDHQVKQNNFLGTSAQISKESKLSNSLKIERKMDAANKISKLNKKPLKKLNQSLNKSLSDSEDSNSEFAIELANCKKNVKPTLTVDNFPLDINIVEKKRQQTLKKSLFGGAQKMKEQRSKASKKQQNIKQMHQLQLGKKQTDSIQIIKNEGQDVVGKQLFDKYTSSAKMVQTSPCLEKPQNGYKNHIGNILLKAYQRAADEAQKQTNAEVLFESKNNSPENSLQTDESVQEYLDREDQY